MWWKFLAEFATVQAGKRSFDFGFALLTQSKFLAQDDNVFQQEHFMKLSWMMIVVFLLGVAICAIAQDSAPAKPISPLEQTLIASEKSLIEARKKDDEAFLKRTVTEDFSLVGVDGNLLQKQEAVEGLGDSDLVELTPYDMKIVSIGEGSAIVTYDAIVRKAPEEDQGPPPRYQHFSSVWVRQGDAWKLKFHQATAAHWGDW